jgi:hypothetical protein
MGPKQLGEGFEAGPAARPESFVSSQLAGWQNRPVLNIGRGSTRDEEIAHK